MEPVYILVVGAIVAVFAALLVSILLRQASHAAPDATESAERSRQLEVELANSREERTLLERRLAVEEQKASRLPELENLIANGLQLIETLTEAKVTAERQLAVSTEALSRGQTSYLEMKERLANAERVSDVLRADKGGLEEMLSGRTEAVARLETSIAEIRDRLTASEQARDRAAMRLDTAIGEKSELQSRMAGATAALAEKSLAIDKVNAELGETKEASAAAQKEVGDLRSRVATLQEALDQERGQSDEKLGLLAEARERMTQEFKILANDVMTSHGETFSKQNREQIDTILGPLREKLSEFQHGLQTSHAESVKERTTLAEQIRQLSGNSERMSTEAASLARALRGESQTQGAWGEMILASILERSGLREGEEYVTQQSHVTEDGQRLRPDVLVNLPGGQRIVVDSKVSLAAFDAHVNATSDVERVAQLTRHVASIRSHIKALASKEYHAAIDGQLDYVVMFIPIEGALAAALQQEPHLTAFAVENNVAIATPTTLMIALRTVANVWHVERRNRNAESIAVRAGRIYDKLVGFIEDMELLGNRLEQARHSHEQAMGKLSSGRGNLVLQVERLKSLGARTSKSLPPAMLGTGEGELCATAGQEETLALVQQD